MTSENQLQQSIIKSFFLEEELDEYVVNLLYEEFAKPGLILLPSGNTFEANIYPKLDSLYGSTEFQTFNPKDQDTKSHQTKKRTHAGLILSHLDELVPDEDSGEKHSFAKAIKFKIPNILFQLTNIFKEIDIDKAEEFSQYLKTTGPRVIFAGLGADPELAHFAFIGEEFINTEVAKINLSPAVKEAHGCTQALTIGTDTLELNSIEQIYVVVKGQKKAESLKAAFEDDSTGLGYVIANHSNKLTIIADSKALELID